MDVPRLEAFLEVARLGSMRAAARSLHLGQPALSARIIALEDELGARVFERTKRGVHLTLAGRALVPHAERALEAIESGRSAVSQVEQGDDGELVIAAASAINAEAESKLEAVATLKQISADAWFEERVLDLELLFYERGQVYPFRKHLIQKWAELLGRSRLQ